MAKLLSLILILSTTIGCNNSLSQNNSLQISDWMLNNSQEIKTLELTDNQNDLNILQQIVGKADLVCLGESRHDISEQFKLKHRFIKYLVEELNFTTFALEASFPYSNKINDYTLNGKGDINEIMANMPGWFLWDTQEMKNILNWLREYNSSPANKTKVKFYGIDIVAPNNALDQIFNYLQKVDSAYYSQIQSKDFAQNIIEDLQWQTSVQRFTEYSEEEKQNLIKNYNELYQHIRQNKIDYSTKLSMDEYDWILMLSYSANEAIIMFSETDRFKMGLIRENAMANISLWIKERNKKLIIWAHNVHIIKSEFTMEMYPDTPIKGMGYIINQKLEDKMISIGASFNKGEFQNENRVFEPAEENTLDGMLSKLNTDYFILDLKGNQKSEEIESWLSTKKEMRAQDFETTCIPIKSFDALFFTNTISKVNYNQTTLEKLMN